MSPLTEIALWALAFGISFSNALPSVPVATDPIVTTSTITTAVPSLVTIYSIIPATDDSNALSTITTTINGQEVITISSGSVVAGSSTSTIVSTLTVTTTEVVVSTIGYSTVFGPDPEPTATPASTPATIPNSAAPTTPINDPATTSVPLGTSTTVSNEIVSSSGASTTKGAIETARVTSSTSSSALAAVATASGSSASSASSSPSLSSGAKAGIGVGVVIGVIGLIVISFFLGQRYSRRRRNEAISHSHTDSGGPDQEKDVFLAGRPYEETNPDQYAGGSTSGKHQSSPATTEVGSTSPGTKFADVPSPAVSSYHSPGGELSALPPLKDDDMYVGVPSYMSGSKRWSMKEYET
ncbi:hypothetical protein LTS17_012443 [Exophiala oligosperma]